MNEGQLDVLNCGEGHLELRITEDNPMELERARRILEDMLKRGYALFIHGKGDKLIRVHKFKPSTMTYLIADGPTVPAEAEPAPVMPARRGRPPLREIKASKAKATVVGRSAGG